MPGEAVIVPAPVAGTVIVPLVKFGRVLDIVGIVRFLAVSGFVTNIEPMLTILSTPVELSLRGGVSLLLIERSKLSNSVLVAVASASNRSLDIICLASTFITHPFYLH